MKIITRITLPLTMAVAQERVKHFIGGDVDENGEVIPGIDWSYGSSPSVIVTPDKSLAATLDTLKAEGRLGDVVAGLPQITTGK